MMFDLVVIAVKPKDFYDAWSEYKIYSKKFLIEKPGALNKTEIERIFLEASNEGRSVLINYEYIYTKESQLLLKKLIGKRENIKEISIVWEKKTIFVWRTSLEIIASLDS